MLSVEVLWVDSLSVLPLSLQDFCGGEGGGGSDIKQWKTQEFIAVERLKHNSETVLFVQFQYEKKKNFFAHFYIQSTYTHYTV